jgi:hypothetical protein
VDQHVSDIDNSSSSVKEESTVIPRTAMHRHVELMYKMFIYTMWSIKNITLTELNIKQKYIFLLVSHFYK